MAHSKSYRLLPLTLAAGAGATIAYIWKDSFSLPDKEPSNQLLTDKYKLPKLVLADADVSMKQVGKSNNYGLNFERAIEKSRNLVHRVKEETGTPGLVIAVNMDGETVWTEGFGYSDLENGVLCGPQTVMRIASISKSITMAALAKLWEEGKVDMDQPVQKYVSAFPQKKFNGEPVEITTRMLTNHLSGIRHWKKKQDRKDTDPRDAPISGSKEEKEEFYLNEKFKNVEESLEVFKNDELKLKPGTKYLYSTPAWTLLSAVMEKAAATPFPIIMKAIFKDLGLSSTCLDENEPIVLNRARYYIRNKHGKLVNAPCVDNSCKWAGGGLQSTVGDLNKFGDAMLYCYQQRGRPGYLKKETIDALWSVTTRTNDHWGNWGGYGMGWQVCPPSETIGGVTPQDLSVLHTGGAVGASSVLLVIPKYVTGSVPAGFSISILVNLQGVNLTPLAVKVGKEFANVAEEMCK